MKQILDVEYTSEEVAINRDKFIGEEAEMFRMEEGVIIQSAIQV